MTSIAGATPGKVPLLKFAFAWNGNELKAGRSPIYGAEAPMKDAQRGTAGPGEVAYRLSPFPYGFPEALDAGRVDIPLHFEPEVPASAGQMHIRIQLAEGRESLQEWVARGMRESPGDGGDVAAEIGSWMQRLSGISPDTIKLGIRRIANGSPQGKPEEAASLGDFILTRSQPVDFELPLGELKIGAERYILDFQAFRFTWERQKSHLPLIWPKESAHRQ